MPSELDPHSVHNIKAEPLDYSLRSGCHGNLNKWESADPCSYNNFADRSHQKGQESLTLEDRLQHGCDRHPEQVDSLRHKSSKEESVLLENTSNLYMEALPDIKISMKTFQTNNLPIKMEPLLEEMRFSNSISCTTTPVRQNRYALASQASNTWIYAKAAHGSSPLLVCDALIEEPGPNRSCDRLSAPTEEAGNTDECNKLDVLANDALEQEARTSGSCDRLSALPYNTLKQEARTSETCGKLHVLVKDALEEEPKNIDKCNKLDVLANDALEQEARTSTNDTCSRLNVLANNPLEQQPRTSTSDTCNKLDVLANDAVAQKARTSPSDTCNKLNVLANDALEQEARTSTSDTYSRLNVLANETSKRMPKTCGSDNTLSLFENRLLKQEFEVPVDNSSSAIDALYESSKGSPLAVDNCYESHRDCETDSSSPARDTFAEDGRNLDTEMIITNIVETEPHVSEEEEGADRTTQLAVIEFVFKTDSKSCHKTSDSSPRSRKNGTWHSESLFSNTEQLTTGGLRNEGQKMVSENRDEASVHEDESGDSCSKYRSGINQQTNPDKRRKLKKTSRPEKRKRVARGSNSQENDKTGTQEKPPNQQITARNQKAKHSCPVCDQGFQTKRRLERHLSSHSLERRRNFKCEVCGKGFTCEEYLKTHRAVHADVKPYSCELCHMGFVSAKGLERHGITHTGDQPFQCETCGKSFSRKGNLVRHMITHSDVKSHKCDVCQKTFFSKSGLELHFASHHGTKSFECSECGKRFGVKSRLSAHFAMHTLPYCCHICGKRFSIKGGLRAHLRLHT